MALVYYSDVFSRENFVKYSDCARSIIRDMTLRCPCDASHGLEKGPNAVRHIRSCAWTDFQGITPQTVVLPRRTSDRSDTSRGSVQKNIFLGYDYYLIAVVKGSLISTAIYMLEVYIYICIYIYLVYIIASTHFNG